MTRRDRWPLRLVRRWAVGVCVVLVAVGVAGVPVYVRPQIDPLRKADAILILGGYGWARYPLGFELARNGWAPVVLVSSPNGPADPWLYQYCATPHPEYTLMCFSPEPPTTKGEARELRRLAAEYGWRTVIVVTFRPHISRARLILERCFDGDLVMVATPADPPVARWVFEYAYQTAGYVRTVLDPAC